MRNDYKTYKVPSKSEPDKKRRVDVFRNGKMRCNCPAGLGNNECRHIRTVKVYLGYVKSDPERCFYTGDVRHLEEHHLLRAADRKFSLSIFITHWVHEIATNNKEFEKHLTNLSLEIMGDRINNLKVNAEFKEANKKVLVSSDLGIRLKLHSYDKSASDLSDLADRKKMVKVSFSGGKLFALVGQVKSQYLESEEKVRHEIRLNVATKEFVNIIRLEKAVFEGDKDVVITYNQEHQVDDGKNDIE